MATIPTVNLNGTSRSSLLNNVRDVYEVLQEAKKLMSEVSPHGRDYQLKPESYQQAIAEYHKNDAAITALIQYYAEIYHGIEDQSQGSSRDEGKVPHIVNRLLREFDYVKADLYNLFIEGHERGHKDSDGRLDDEEQDACPFCKGALTVGVDPNEGE